MIPVRLCFIVLWYLLSFVTAYKIISLIFIYLLRNLEVCCNSLHVITLIQLNCVKRRKKKYFWGGFYYLKKKSLLVGRDYSTTYVFFIRLFFFLCTTCWLYLLEVTVIFLCFFLFWPSHCFVILYIIRSMTCIETLQKVRCSVEINSDGIFYGIQTHAGFYSYIFAGVIFSRDFQL